MHVFNKNDDAEIVENSFFNLWCYNEYVKDTFETNKLKHFEHILKDNGFELSSMGEIKAISKEVNKEMKTIETDHDEKIFEEYLKATDEERNNIKYSNFTSNIKALGLDGESNEILEKYKDIFMDNFKMTDYFNNIRLLKTNEYIEKKLKEASENTYDIEKQYEQNTQHTA